MIKILLVFLLVPLISNADQTKLPIPRFAAIKSNEVNARTGPSIKSTIEWIFIKKGEPVEIIAEHEQWRQIRDIDGQGGWVHSSVLSGKRSVIVKTPSIIELTKNPGENSKIVAKLANSVRCILKKCKDSYCQIVCSGHTGWVNKNSLWGVYLYE